MYKNKDGSTTKMNMDPKLFESDENDEVVMRLRDRVNKEEKARIKAIEQAEFDKKQEEIKRKQAEMKVKLESITLLFLKKFSFTFHCTFDSDGKILTKSNVNGDRLPMVGKECVSRYKLSTEHKVNSSFAKFKQNLFEMRDKKNGAARYKHKIK